MSTADDTDRREQRWAAYLAATVVAVLEDGPVDLTGADAVVEWPFDGHVLALTGWDPAGRTRQRSDNDRANQDLRSLLVASGAIVHDSSGYMTDPGGSADSGGLVFVDHGFVVEGMDEANVLDVARRFGQEAIYRIDARGLTVISADDPSDRDTRDRLSTPSDVS